jgi:hypothetical protein
MTRSLKTLIRFQLLSSIFNWSAPTILNCIFQWSLKLETKATPIAKSHTQNLNFKNFTRDLAPHVVKTSMA